MAQPQYVIQYDSKTNMINTILTTVLALAVSIPATIIITAMMNKPQQAQAEAIQPQVQQVLPAGFVPANWQTQSATETSCNNSQARGGRGGSYSRTKPNKQKHWNIKYIYSHKWYTPSNSQQQSVATKKYGNTKIDYSRSNNDYYQYQYMHSFNNGSYNDDSNVIATVSNSHNDDSYNNDSTNTTNNTTTTNTNVNSNNTADDSFNTTVTTNTENNTDSNNELNVDIEDSFIEDNSENNNTEVEVEDSAAVIVATAQSTAPLAEL